MNKLLSGFYTAKDQEGRHTVWERLETEPDVKMCTTSDGEEGERKATFIAAALNYVERNGISC
jgi:hypothetical protein